MFLPNLNFNLTYLDTDDDIFERIGRRNSAIGVRQRESDHRSLAKKGRPVTKIWLLSNLRFGEAVLGSPQLILSSRSSPSTDRDRQHTTPPTPHHTYTMNTESHGDLLADRLRRLDIPDDHPVPVQTPKAPYDGYGFRSSSGRTSPRAPSSPLPDVNGLGWPGTSSFLVILLFAQRSTTIRSPSPPITSKVDSVSP